MQSLGDRQAGLGESVCLCLCVLKNRVIEELYRRELGSMGGMEREKASSVSPPNTGERRRRQQFPDGQGQDLRGEWQRALLYSGHHRSEQRRKMVR